MLGGGLLELIAVDGRLGIGGAERLVGHRGPQEPGELAGNSDVRDRRAFPVVGEVPVAVIKPDLGLPGALVALAGRWRGVGERGGSRYDVGEVPLRVLLRRRPPEPVTWNST